MPKADIHHLKKKKNLMILGAIVAWVILIWAITIIKMTGSATS